MKHLKDMDNQKSIFKDGALMASSIHQLLEQKKATLAVAESLTGGLVSHLLTLRPKASQFFLGSIVCYSSLIKIKHLSVPKKLVTKKGVVNEPVALLMAKNMRKKWGSDYSLSLTGLAGPDKEAGDPPVGTVFVACSGPKGTKAKKLFFEKEAKKTKTARWTIQQKSAFLALSFFKNFIEKDLTF